MKRQRDGRLERRLAKGISHAEQAPRCDHPASTAHDQTFKDRRIGTPSKALLDKP